MYIGWGSMMAVSPEHMADVAVRALKLSGLRGVVLGGWAKLNLDKLPEDLVDYAKENVLFVASAPHEWLFPQCCATVHHGGAGTTAAALRAGVPTVITPCLFDQFDHAHLVSKGGCGVGLRALSKVKGKELAAALTRCTTDDAMIARAAELGEGLQKEDGLTQAVATVDKFVAEDLETGRWLAKFEQQLEDRRQPIGRLRMLRRLFFSRRPFDKTPNRDALAVN